METKTSKFTCERNKNIGFEVTITIGQINIIKKQLERLEQMKDKTCMIQ
jgi:hypothetical protein